jgi:hypothetical protein
MYTDPFSLPLPLPHLYFYVRIGLRVYHLLNPLYSPFSSCAHWCCIPTLIRGFYDPHLTKLCRSVYQTKEFKAVSRPRRPSKVEGIGTRESVSRCGSDREWSGTAVERKPHKVTVAFVRKEAPCGFLG